ncbi:MAG: RNA polymerase sigma-70 factor [Mariniphaga sp.]|nr:RNA polymerase sigma-70 factor [Mariniphaga sp.]
MKVDSGAKGWFGEVFHQNYEYILNYLYYLSGDAALAEDLVQDVFLQLWEKRSDVKEETLRSFLFAIARNSFLKNKRRQKYDLKFRSDYLVKIENESPDYILEMKEFDARLQKAIAGLPEKSRVIFLMHRLDEMTYSEIAENLGVSIKAIEKQMSKALKVLRKELGNNI